MPLLTTKDRLDLTIGGKYRFDRVLVECGMGVVYAGHHLRLDLPVAVKFLHPQYSRTTEIVERFLREARATSRLVHPNVVGVRDVDVAEDGSAFMVLEFLEGRSLATHLEHEKVLSVDETLAILLPVCDALMTAHQLGIIHRDIKPDNIFLSRGPDGRMTPKVLDFGIAKLTGQGSGPSATATGAVLGTALYMAPEQAMGKTNQVGAVSDVWSTAVMTYECLTGGFPFNLEFGPEMNAMAVMIAAMTATIVPLSDKRKELGVMSGVLTRALDRNPSTRTQSMSAFADDLRSAASKVNAQARKSRVLSGPPSQARLTTGPMDAQSASGADALAGTALPHPVVLSPNAPSSPASSGAASAGAANSVVHPPMRPVGVYVAAGALLVLMVGGAAIAGFGAATASESVEISPVVVPPIAVVSPEREATPTIVTPVTPSEVEAPPVVPHVGAADGPRVRAAEVRAAEATVTASSDAVAQAEARAAEARAAETRAAEARAAEARAAEARARAAEATTTDMGTDSEHRAGGISVGEF